VFATIKREASKEGYFALPREGSPFFISMELFLSQHLLDGQELSEKEFLELREKQQCLFCRDKALVYLARREHTAFELKLKLQAKAFTLEEISWALEYLKDKNYLSELRYARSFIESRQRKNPEGRVMLSRRLAEKGVNRSDAEQALDEFFSEEQISEYVMKAYAMALKTADPDMARLKLQKKGFTRYYIRCALEANGDDIL
jgi:regulatory protein